MIYIFTGDGKGKTSAALGTAVRALGNSWSVAWIAFYKEASWNVSEYQLPQLLKLPKSQRFTMELLGKGFYIQKPENTVALEKGSIKVASVGAGKGKVSDDNTPDEHRLAALSALARAEALACAIPKYELIILDEVLNALNDKLLTKFELRSLIDHFSSSDQHLVLTGRRCPRWLRDTADLVTSMVKRKHPYDSGILAIKGLDY